MKQTKIYNPNNSNDNANGEQRRRYPRRANDVCMVNVDGHPYPVVDWSQCGILFEGNAREYSAGQTVNMIMRFKVGSDIEDVKITGEIVRTNATTIATTFDNVPQETLKSFKKVIQSSVA